ncbi:Phospholipase/Carboxylesterase [Chryseolinea serpens]|uniref:Phospholipase/Carboxylesterase n=1 Tax=Chryseolinea serpens TaxID=947013 RepID=A0A1M5KSE7_9BACT|nr:prolyl oligopeptidase family serine peptidase [Chryseolinea serpens]SHG55646.1 Phospholipase/Carboxylesterase [Chryseolinea serpens]
MKSLGTLFLFSTVMSMAIAQDSSLYRKYTFTGTAGLTMPYRILYPEGYDPLKKYPVVLLLHGAGERGTDNEKQLKWGASLFLKRENRRTFPCFVVVPQCPENDYWASVKFQRNKRPFDLDFNYKAYTITHALKTVMELLENMKENEGVDRKRVYIIGLSMGGMGAVEAVYRYPRTFAGAVSICGGGDVRAYSKEASRVPFWLFHGEKDDVVAVENSRRMRDRLKELGAEVKYTEYPDVGHESWINAFADTDLLPWLFFHNR